MKSSNTKHKKTYMGFLLALFVVVVLTCACSAGADSSVDADPVRLEMYRATEAVHTEGIHYGTLLDISDSVRGFFVCDTRKNDDGTYTSAIDFVEFAYAVSECDGKLTAGFKVISREKCVVHSSSGGEIQSMRYTNRKENKLLQFSDEKFGISLYDLEGKPLSPVATKYDKDGSIEVQSYTDTAENISVIEYTYSAKIKGSVGKDAIERDIEIIFEEK